MERLESGKKSKSFDTLAKRGFRYWLLCDKPMEVVEVGEDGVEHVVAVGLLAKEWRLRGDSVRVDLSTSGEWMLLGAVVEREMLDQTPVEFSLPPPISASEEIRRLVRQELSLAAENRGLESFDEAMDFDVAGEDEWRSPYELQELDEEFPNEVVEDESEESDRGNGRGSGAAENPSGAGGVEGGPVNEPGSKAAGLGDSGEAESDIGGTTPVT